MNKFLVIFLCLAILPLTTLIGIFLAIQLDVYLSAENDRTPGRQIDYLPEKIVKLETGYRGGGGIHFLGESGKLYACDFDRKTCAGVETPDRVEGDPAFRQTGELYPKFAPPPVAIKQTVISRNRGLMGHHTERQYAVLEDGTVWFWIFSGNEMNRSFPFWHLEHWLTIVLGALGGMFFGLIISTLIWLKFHPRS